MTLEQKKESLKRLCKCCGLDPELPTYDLCCDTYELSNFGSGYVLFFHLMKLCLGLCVLLLLFSLYKLQKNWNGKGCIDPNDYPGGLSELTNRGYCVRDWVTVHSYANSYDGKFDVRDKSLMIVYFGFYFLIVSFFGAFMNKANEQVDANNDIPGDWTVEVRVCEQDQRVGSDSHSRTNQEVFRREKNPQHLQQAPIKRDELVHRESE